MPPPLRVTETLARLHERFAPARLHVAASALEAEHLAALAEKATWCSGSCKFDSDKITGHDTAAAGDMLMLLGKWPILLHAHLLLVRQLCAISCPPRRTDCCVTRSADHGDCVQPVGSIFPQRNRVLSAGSRLH